MSFLALCRLHSGSHVEDLADRFDISAAIVSRTCLAWLKVLYIVLGSINIWPSQASIDKFMSSVMKEKFSTVHVIIDCTEMFTQKPSSLVGNSQLFSSYKNHTTLKGLIGISPHGSVTFVSSLFSGCISDIEITKNSEILNLPKPGDSLMANKGFTVAKLLAEHNFFCHSTFLLACVQFHSAEVADNGAITASWVHVERTN